MRKLSLTVVAVLMVVSGVAAASTVQVPPVAKTYKPPARSPIAFAKVPSAQGFSRELKRGVALKSGQTIELVIAKGANVVPARDCACQGLGLVQPKGQKLASVYVQVRSSSGKPLATSPAKQLFIEGNGAGGLPVGFTYAFAKGTKPFPKGSRLVIYGFFTSS
jgi:hypothetical protein